ncbi:MAG: T9SS type A sorting domain-containing protein [Bacteroidota bacterium]
MKKVLLALFVLSLSTLVFAQTDISITNVNLIDTAYLNSNQQLSLSFTNNAAVDFTGSIEAKATVQGHPIPDLITASSLPIAASASTQFTGLSLLIAASNYFTLGDNVVVIWPIAMTPTDTTIGDTVQQKVHVLFPNGIDNLELNSKLSIASVLKNQWLIMNKTQTAISESNIYDLNGKRIETISGNNNQVDLENISSGIYLLEIKLADGRKASFKILVQ